MATNQDIHKIYWQMKNHENNYAGRKIGTELFSKVRDRSTMISWIALGLSCAVILRLTYINTISSQFLTDQMNTRVLRTIKLPSMRGTITDRNNHPLAVSTPMEAIWADPSALDNLTSEQVQQLAKVLDMPLADLNKKLNETN